MENIELRKLLLKLGIYSNIQGYHYILEAYNIIARQKIHTNMITIYREIGKKNDKHPSGVERAIRHCIQKCYKTGKLNNLYDEIPDNSVFIYDLYFNFDIIKKQIEEF